MSYRSNQAFRAVAATALLTALGGTGTALAAAPTIETFPVNETFPDEILSEACGVDVTTTVIGQGKLRTLDEGTGIQSVLSIKVSGTAVAGDNVYRFRDVGADVVTVRSDGTVVELKTGQDPTDEFIGATMINVITGEVILEPTNSTDTTAACDALTG